MLNNRPWFLRKAAASLAALFALGLAGCGQTVQIPDSTPAGSTSQIAVLPEDSSFSIHFIDVGQADSALVSCDGEYMLIDGGNADDSNLEYTVMQRETDGHLEYMVGTHAHEDHIGGLSGAFEAVTADTTFCPVTEYDSKVFRSFKSHADENGGGITVPEVGETFGLGSATVTIVGVNSVPDDTNDTSIVLRIVYGDTSFLFTGDAEEAAEDVILRSGLDLNSTVLKVGHHGSSTSTSQRFLDAVDPDYAVISCGKDNSYGHPHAETLAKLKAEDIEVFRTDELGDIYCTSDGQTVSFSYGEYHKPAATNQKDRSEPESEAASEPEMVPSEPTAEQTARYVLNTKTRKFHTPSCSSVEQISKTNRKDYEGGRETIIEQGYDPCGYCKP